ncbi:phosphohydrolase [Vibrio sp. HA2012]|uniref:HD domain-containing phosphohydrolase n=1 Tax=Vibrio sp. HA2012 TaxID=1971595 RepID=UPI000C2BCE25|nr:HD domain-containing phosphohydrolase [Vibrio sp. HA2012]PJC87229.1 phosphohydrolase [Vibrio sp. HA2012]
MNNLTLKEKRFSIRFTVGSLFLIAATLMSVFAIALQYHFSKEMAMKNALSEFSSISEQAGEYIDDIDTNAIHTIELLTKVFSTRYESIDEVTKRDILIQALKNAPLFYSLYLGSDTNDFYQIINLNSSPVVRRRIEAGDNDRWVIIKIYGDNQHRIRENSYYTQDLELTKKNIETSNYFPVERPWFRSGNKLNTFKTQPYLFQHLKITGQTYSKRVPGTDIVLGLDCVLSSLLERLIGLSADFGADSGTEIFIFNGEGDIISTNVQSQQKIRIPPSKALTLSQEQKTLIKNTRSLKVSNQMTRTPLDFALAGEPQGYAVDVLRLVSEMTGLHFEFINGFTLPELVEQFGQGALDILNAVPGSAIRDLTGIPSQPLFSVPEVPMSDKSESYYLVMAEADDPVIRVINMAVSNISSEQWQALNTRWLHTLSVESGWQASVPYQEISSLTGQPDQHKQLILSEVNGQSRYFYVEKINSKLANNEFLAVIVPADLILEKTIRRILSALILTVLAMLALLPVAWFFGTPIVTPIRQLRAETKKVKARQFRQVSWVNSRIKEVWELSDSIVEMSKEIQKRENEQEQFVEALIRLIAQAIDDKSPYTAGHCNRVPELGMMLADAAERASYGPLKTFQFNNEDEKREFRIAAWLHDCGKLITPEYIVDKGTKLECICNRINEIRTRFEVLWRDAEIGYLQAVYQQGEDDTSARQVMEQRRKQLQDDFAFIASVNVGSESVSEETLARLQQISLQEWFRNFDDSLGLSPVEEQKRPRSPSPLPAREQLLADKAEHYSEWAREVKYAPELGIRMDVPEFRSNHGELYNLSVGRGTLTDEDRFIINEHIISTIKMLESLPFSAELSRVPRYASTHHETLTGSGYPRKLTGDQLSVPERILAIADIFEALTAADRPYKKAKPLSVAIDILYHMALDEHIDMDIFRLFLESGVYLRYAEKYLPDEQIDAVDIEQYVGENKTGTQPNVFTTEKALPADVPV